LEDDVLLDLIKLIDDQERFWHVDGIKLYKKKAWLESETKKERRRKEDEIISEIKNIRLKVIRQLQYKLAEEFGLESNNEQIIKIAVNILKTGKTKLASILDVDIKDIPDMPVRYTIIDGKVEIVL